LLHSRCLSAHCRRRPIHSSRCGWVGVARPPADNEEASVYWEDKWDARGKRFKPNEVSCAHRTEAFGTIFIVTNLDNGKKIDCPVQTAGRSRKAACSTSRSAPREKIGCEGLCASPCAAPATSDGIKKKRER